MKLGDFFSLALYNMKSGIGRIVPMLVMVIIIGMLTMTYATVFYIEETTFASLYEEKYSKDGTVVRLAVDTDDTSLKFNKQNVCLDYSQHEKYIDLLKNCEHFDVIIPPLRSSMKGSIYGFSFMITLTDFLQPVNVVEGVAPTASDSYQNERIWISSAYKTEIKAMTGVDINAGDSFSIKIENVADNVVKNFSEDVSVVVAGITDDTSLTAYMGMHYYYLQDMVRSSSQAVLYNGIYSYKELYKNQRLLMEKINAEIEVDGYKINASTDLIDSYDGYRAKFSFVFFVSLPFVLFILIINLLGIINNVLLSFSEHDKRFALMQLLGMKNRTIFAMVAVEFVIVSVVGIGLASAFIPAFKQIVLQILNYNMYGHISSSLLIDFDWVYSFPIYIPFIVLAGILFIGLVVIAGKTLSSKKMSYLDSLREGS